jgi:CubicO group peptidase (beta-lactamase class C family)
MTLSRHAGRGTPSKYYFDGNPDPASTFFLLRRSQKEGGPRIKDPAAQSPSGFGYGATFWTFAPGSGVPADAYIAQGNRGQYLAIVPSRNIVIVRRGCDGPQTAFDPAPFVRDVLAALR